MQTKSEMINRIAELAEENAELKKYIERMDKPKIQVIDAEILTLKEENAKLNAIIDSYQPKIQALKDENFELKESLKCFQKPEVVKVLTDYRTGEIDNLKAENERLKEEIKEYKKRSKCAWKCFENTLCEEGEKYKTCLREIQRIILNQVNWVGQLTWVEQQIQDIINKAGV